MPTIAEQERKDAQWSDLLYSNHFASEIRHLRESFFQSQETLPMQARKQLKDFHRSRLTLADGHPLLGELLPWLFGDFLGVLSHPKFTSVARNWLGINYSIMMADDILDQPNANRDSLTLTSLLLLERGLSGLLTTVPNPVELRLVCDEAFSRCADAAFKELEWRADGAVPDGGSSLKVVERKFAIAEVCFAALAGLLESDQSSKPLKYARKFHDKLILGLQMLDDLTDWPEDLERNHQTFLLTRAVRRSPRIRTDNTGAAVDTEFKFLLLVQTGAITETVSLAKDALAGARGLVDEQAKSGTPLLLTALRRADVLLEESREAAECLRGKLLATFPMDQVARLTAREMIKEANAHQQYARLQKSLVVINQHS